jgi:CheY-like chemotaxis protein
MHVLLLSENRIDQALFEQSVKDLGTGHSFTACESIADLGTRLMARQMPLPSVIFVDFELSQRYGDQLVQMLNGNDKLRTAPVIVIAECTPQEEIAAAYLLQAPCFLSFPKQVELRRQRIQACVEFWSAELAQPDTRRTVTDEVLDRILLGG